jgi:hypothetical protein
MARARDEMVLRRPRQSKAHRFVTPSVWLMMVRRRPPELHWNEYVLQTIGAESKAKRWSRDDNRLNARIRDPGPGGTSAPRCGSTPACFRARQRSWFGWAWQYGTVLSRCGTPPAATRTVKPPFIVFVWRSAEFLGKSDEKPFRPADVAEPIRVFILDDFAYKLRAARVEPFERIADVVHGEHDAEVA